MFTSSSCVKHTLHRLLSNLVVQFAEQICHKSTYNWAGVMTLLHYQVNNILKMHSYFYQNRKIYI